MRRKKLKILLILSSILIFILLGYLYLEKPSVESPVYKYGDKPLEFEGENLKGQKVKFKNEPNKVKLLVFLSNMSRDLWPYLSYYNVIRGDFNAKNLQVMLISSLPKGYLMKLRKDLGLSFDIIVDPTKKLERKFVGVKSPTIHMVLIDKNGVIRFSGTLLDFKSIRTLVKRYLKGEGDKDKRMEITLHVGSKFPPIGLTETRRLVRRRISQFQGRPTVLTFVISPCPTCPEEKRLSLLKKIAEKYGQRIHNLVVYHPANSVSLINAVRERHGNAYEAYLLLIDTTFDALSHQLFNPWRSPLTLLLDEKGKIAFIEAKGKGPKDLKALLEKAIARTLREEVSK